MDMAGWVAAGAHPASVEAATAQASARRARFITIHRVRGIGAARTRPREETEIVSPTAAMRQGAVTRSGAARASRGRVDRNRRTPPPEGADDRQSLHPPDRAGGGLHAAPAR